MLRSLFLFVVLTAATLNLSAQSSGIGAGLSTDGLNAKYWMGPSNALSINWNLGSSISVDYLFDKPELLQLTEQPTPVYYGAGAFLGTHKELNDDLEETTELDLGVRGILGISYYIKAYPVDIYLESTPSIGLLGGSGFSAGGTLGIRYFF